MNTRLFMHGILLGALLGLGILGGAQLSGFAVMTFGEQTLNLGLTVQEDTLIPLTIPKNLTRLTMTGQYAGSGSVTVHLVGAAQAWHIATYDAPETHVNTTFLLTKGGTVVQLPELGNITYTHVFSEACGDTCDTILEGPFYLQVQVHDGALTIASISYNATTWISQPETPPEDPAEERINITLPVPEPEPGRQNPPTECETHAQCGAEFRCESQYCISSTGHLNITDHTGRLVALFDKHGKILLAGDVHENTQEEPPTNAFRIQNRWADIAWVTTTGDLYLTGDLHEEVTDVPIVGEDNFIIRNPERAVCVVQGTTGGMYTVSVLASGVLG